MLQSPVDMAIVAGIILLVFGPKKVPELGKALGQGIGNFKRALFEAQDEVKTALKEEPSKSAQMSNGASTTAVPVSVVMDKTATVPVATAKEEEVPTPRW